MNNINNIETLLKNNILKNFNLNKKINADKFNNKLVKKNKIQTNIQLDDRLSKTKKLFKSIFSSQLNEEQIYKKDYTTSEKNKKNIIYDNNTINSDIEKNENPVFGISPALKERLVKAIYCLHHLLFKDLNAKNDLDKNAIIIISNILFNNIFAYKNISIDEVNKYQEKLKKYKIIDLSDAIDDQDKDDPDNNPDINPDFFDD